VTFAAPTGSGNCGPARAEAQSRALYRRVGDVMVIAAVAPEAQVDPRGFDRAPTPPKGA
jgi:hypothetical protein